MGKGAGKGGREAQNTTAGSTLSGDRPLNRTRPLQGGASYSLRTGDALARTGASLVVPEWSVPCQALQWEEPYLPLDGTRDRKGLNSNLSDDISRRHSNNQKIDGKLPGPGNMKLTQSYNGKFRDDPSPYDAHISDPRPVHCTILKGVQTRKSGAFAKEHAGSFHPLFAYRVCRPSTFLREDTAIRRGGSIRLDPFEDSATMANKTWNSMANTGAPSNDQL